jgi:hypothetical protein
LTKEHELKIKDVVLAKTRQFDKIKRDLEAGIQNFEQELLRLAADNVTLSRSFQVYLEGFFVWEQDPWFMTY